MDKIVRLGTSKTYGGRRYSVYARIRITEGGLSITGVEGPLPSGNCLGSCGQIVQGKPTIVNLASGWTRAKLAWFWAVWDKWHLNDMRSACEHQRDIGRVYATDKGMTCQVCGYKIGTSWLMEPLPEHIVTFLESLPETDKTPAWA